MSRDKHEGGGDALALRFIGPRSSKRYEVSNVDGKTDRVSVAECKKRVTALLKEVKEAKFTGVDASVKGCGKKGRDSIVRTLKRHSEIAHDAEFNAQDGAFVHKKHGKATFENQALTVEGVKPVLLEDVKIDGLRVALSPSKRLMLVLSGGSSGATLVYAANVSAEDGTPTQIGLE